MSDDVNEIMAELVDQWCERRALGLLSTFLPGFRSLNGLTDGWEICYGSLRDVRTLHRDELTETEKEKINSAINLIGQMLNNR